MKSPVLFKHIISNTQHLINTKRNLGIIALNCLAFLLLIGATLYCARPANTYMINNSDALIYPYLFEDLSLNDLSLPAEHSNVVKFPLFFVQALIPYNDTTFSVVSIGLFMVTIFVWLALLVWLFGKKYIGLISVLLTAILLGSPSLDSQLFGTTIRNVEYPIALAFLVFIAKLAFLKGRLSRLHLVSGIAISILYALTIAGDTLIMYQTSGAIAMVLLISWLKGSLTNKSLGLVAAVLLGATLLGVACRTALVTIGVMDIADNLGTTMQVVPLDRLAPSITTTAKQTMDMFGGNIFGSTISLQNSLVFLNFGLLLITLWVFTAKLRGIATKTLWRPDRNPALEFIILASSAAFFITILIYIISDQAVVTGENGAYVAAGRERYLTLLPLLAVIGLVYSLKSTTINRLKNPALIILAVLCVLILSHSSISVKQHSNDQSAADYRQSIKQVADQLKARNVKVFGTGYWYGASVKFNSSKSIDFVSVHCFKMSPEYNTRYSWYAADPSIKKSALVIDRTGPDKPYWPCSDAEIEGIYGRPTQKQQLKGKHPLSIWFYNYDIRTKTIK